MNFLNKKMNKIPELKIGDNSKENKVIKFFKFFWIIPTFSDGKVNGFKFNFNFKIGKKHNKEKDNV